MTTPSHAAAILLFLGSSLPLLLLQEDQDFINFLLIFIVLCLEIRLIFIVLRLEFRNFLLIVIVSRLERSQVLLERLGILFYEKDTNRSASHPKVRQDVTQNAVKAAANPKSGATPPQQP